MAEVNDGVAGLLAVALNARLIEKLSAKGVLTREDAEQVFTGALNNLADANERADAAAILQAIMPTARITR